MELATILHSSLANLPFHTPFFHSKFLHSFSKTIHHRTSLPSPCLTISRPPPRKYLSINCSFSDDTTSTTKVATVDPSIALKDRFHLFIYPLIQKKATDLSADLSGTSIFLVHKNLAYSQIFLQTEVLKQLSSMGRLGVCTGDGAVQDSTNLALLRHGISIWIDVPLDMVAKGIIENKSLLLSSEIAISGSYSEVLSQLTVLYGDMRIGYATADATISIQRTSLSSISVRLRGHGCSVNRSITMEALKEIEILTRVKKDDGSSS
ncbi:hypothetical protein CRYUN_Cryun17cG0004700 [Craigia yunnanensis]